MAEVLGDYALIRTPWNCEFRSDTLFDRCRQHMDAGTPRCPGDLTICCYFCGKQPLCCDKCEFLTVDEGDFER